tara:strand:- start:538 stop:723 length:186 start_codon:yes stop_codon:yes gene_type:complete
MDTNKKSGISEDFFSLSKTISNASTTAHLYGKLFMLRDMQIFLAEKEIKLNEQIKKDESND